MCSRRSLPRSRISRVKSSQTPESPAKLRVCSRVSSIAKCSSNAILFFIETSSVDRTRTISHRAHCPRGGTILPMTKPYIIALEEHYWDAEVATHFKAPPDASIPAIHDRLMDLGALRLKDMDEAGVDFQVLSPGAPAIQRVGAGTRVGTATRGAQPP